MGHHQPLNPLMLLLVILIQALVFLFWKSYIRVLQIEWAWSHGLCFSLKLIPKFDPFWMMGIFTPAQIEPGIQGDREPGIRGAREPGCQGARESGSQGAEEPGIQGAGDPGNRGAREAVSGTWWEELAQLQKPNCMSCTISRNSTFWTIV